MARKTHVEVTDKSQFDHDSGGFLGRARSVSSCGGTSLFTYAHMQRQAVKSTIGEVKLVELISRKGKAEGGPMVGFAGGLDVATV
jgi:transketolase